MNFIQGALVSVNTVLSIGNNWINNIISQVGDYVQKNEQLSKLAMILFNLYVRPRAFEVLHNL